MKKEFPTLILITLLGLLCLLPDSAFAADNQGISVADYQVKVEFDQQGDIKEHEQVRYQFDKQVDQLSHVISTGESGHLRQLNVDMRMNSASEAFPFVQSTSHTVGTFDLHQNGNNVQVDLYNTMSGDDEIVNYIANIEDVWTKYGNQVIMQKDFLLLPFDIHSAQITFKFPQAVDQNHYKTWLASPAHIQEKWLDESTLQVQVRDLRADSKLNVQMVLPADVMPNIKGEGPVSKGEQINREIDKHIGARQAWYRQRYWIVMGVSLALVALLILYTYFLLRRKQKIRQAAGAKQVNHSHELNPVEVSELLKKNYSQHDKLWLVLLSLVAKGHLALRFVNADDRFYPYFKVLASQSDDPYEQVVLDAFSKQQEGGELDFASFKYSLGLKKKGKTRNYRNLLHALSKLDKKRKQDLQLLDKFGSRFYGFLWWLYVTVFIVLAGLVIWLTWEINRGHIWLLALAFCLVGIYLLRRYTLPIYNSQGQELAKYWKTYFNSLKGRDQSLGYSQKDYLYSFVTGDNYRLVKQAKKANQSLSGNLAQALDAVDQYQLKDFM
ncbi:MULTISPECIES: DUF2207 family protein [Aerococcus]|uniref:DUF2207 domain-containing protein n=1 Tax=Aerococcus tenax TaxID=3078812 RepID=A0A5N1BMW0_9LACT|nr:DUF2207 domain-containing protein [Aerococcus urinae]KAA9241538.1 DUF2207 domain-containing protein [Aerococcus urinae]MDK6370687.1 DUF2207 domain-containing protein [Aerococcus urinae]MDK6598094.1 DUF2207 domain-containing protein [Aerococcus urinae]MDK7302106.1 DUF2207 domain-containing protein [Aerococcus urinae]MDK7800944.1 DUF2207 domain-containing protein [Aerococcus urinae]